jgi:hypothetical protein
MRIFDNSIEALVIDCLREGKMTGPEIVSFVASKRAGATKQAVYLALRVLMHNEVVVHFKQSYRISDLFLDKVIGYFDYLKSGEAQKTNSEPFLNLSDGDSISYSFKTPYVTDTFWAHAFAVLTSYTPNEVPIVIYNPHEWFIYAHTESEQKVLEAIIKQGKYAFFTIGTKTSADAQAKKYFTSPHTQYFINDSIKGSLPSNYYLNIFDDYIIEVWLDDKITKNIDAWYEGVAEVTQNDIEKIESIVQQKGRTKMRISRNKKRAQRLSKQFIKNFYMPKI